MSGDTWLSQLLGEGSLIGIWWTKARDTATHPTIHRTALTTVFRSKCGGSWLWVLHRWLEPHFPPSSPAALEQVFLCSHSLCFMNEPWNHWRAGLFDYFVLWVESSLIQLLPLFCQYLGHEVCELFCLMFGSPGVLFCLPSGMCLYAWWQMMGPSVTHIGPWNWKPGRVLGSHGSHHQMMKLRCREAKWHGPLAAEFNVLSIGEN